VSPRPRCLVAGLLAGLLGCAPIDVDTQVSVEPREGPPRQIGGEQLVARDFVADYVQVGPRLLVELRELRSCAQPRHLPVLRTEHVHRSSRGFVIWDFALGAFTGAFAALAFARPQLFSNRLVDGMGREIRDYSGAYIVGGVFSAISVALLTTGVVDALRSRDTTRYADAYEVELGPARPCGGVEATALDERALRLVVAGGVIELDGHTDAEGRVRFELPSWSDDVPESGEVPAVIEIAPVDGPDGEARVLVFPLRVPYTGLTDAHAGTADTRRSTKPPAPLEFGVEGPSPAPESP
jgi:hypothetical protein